MKYEHKAIIDAASREGKAPSELAKELLGHDLLKAMVTAISKPAVAFSKMSEQQQESTIEDLKKELLPAISTAISVIVSQNTHAVRMKLKKLATGPAFQLTGTLDKSQDHIHELIDLASDNSDVLIILHERDYVQGLDGIKGEKDQKDLDLAGNTQQKKVASKPKSETGGKKAIELTPGQIEQAREFVTRQQNANHAGLQNFLKCNFDKAEALLAHLQGEGLVTEADERGNRNLVRPGATTESPVAEPTVNDAGLPVDSEGHVIMSDALFEKARGKVVESQEVTKGGLCVAFDLDDEVVKLLLDKLEEEGVISEQDDLGGREVYQKSL